MPRDRIRTRSRRSKVKEWDGVTVGYIPVRPRKPLGGYSCFVLPFAILVLFFHSDYRLNKLPQCHTISRSRCPALASSKRRGARLYDEPLTINDQSVTHSPGEGGVLRSQLEHDICNTFLVKRRCSVRTRTRPLNFTGTNWTAGRISEPRVTVTSIRGSTAKPH
jgi:hypothetical protein